jgi:succinoglycan biosynthesis transport protein ExoP
MLVADQKYMKSLGQRTSGDPGDIAFLFGLFRRQRSLIAKVVLGGAVLGLLILVVIPASYQATAVVLVDFKRLAVLDENFSTSTGRIDSSAILSQLEVVRSEGVISRTVIEQKLDEDPEFIGKRSLLASFFAMVGLIDGFGEPVDERRRVAVEAVKKALSVERVDISYALSINFSSRYPEKAAKLANAIAEGYIQDQLDAKRTASEKASEWFSQRIAELQRDVNDAERRTLEYKVKNNIVTSDMKFIDEQQLFDMSQKQLQARLDRQTAEAKVDQIEAMIKSGNVKSALVDEFKNEVVIQLRNAYLEAQRMAADIAIRYGANHDGVIKNRQKMTELQNALTDEFRRIEEGAKSDAAIAQIKERALDKEMASLADRSNDLQGARVEYSRLQSLADTVKTIRDTFMSRYVDGIQKQSFPITEARVISAARPPTKASFPTPFKAIGGGILLGFGFGCLLGIANEAFSRTVRFRRQAEEALGVPCVGFLPSVGGARAGEARMMNGPYIETLRSVKVSIDLSRRNPYYLLGVVSAQAGEGKSFTAAQLARLCAQSGAHTLLIDANIRNPSLSREIAANRLAGLCEVTAGLATVAEAVRATSYPNLSFLPCFGQMKPSEPGTWLLLESLSVLLRALSDRYDYIIMDLPALGLVADARAIVDLLDGFLMVVEWDKTKANELDDALRSNPEVNAKLIGSVINKADLKRLRHLREPSAMQYAV